MCIIYLSIFLWMDGYIISIFLYHRQRCSKYLYTSLCFDMTPYPLKGGWSSFSWEVLDAPGSSCKSLPLSSRTSHSFFTVTCFLILNCSDFPTKMSVWQGTECRTLSAWEAWLQVAIGRGKLFWSPLFYLKILVLHWKCFKSCLIQ